MTALDLDAIKARAEKATLGPWHSMPDTGGNVNWVLGRTADPDDGYYGTTDVIRIADDNLDGSYLSDDDAEFIAQAREDVPALVAEVKRLQAVIESAWASVDHNCESYRILTGEVSPTLASRTSDSSEGLSK